MTFINAAMIIRLPEHTRLSALALTAALGLAGCSATSARLASSRQDSVQPSRSAGAAVPAVRCTGAMLRIQAGREGVNAQAHGDVEFTDVGSRPCILRGLPRVAILQADRKPLPVRSIRDPNASPATISVIDAYGPGFAG